MKSATAEELADAGILHRRSVERGTTGYLALDVFDLPEAIVAKTRARYVEAYERITGEHF